jgi:hypothetical protein
MWLSFGGPVQTQRVTQLWQGSPINTYHRFGCSECRPFIIIPLSRIEKQTCNFFTRACVKSDGPWPSDPTALCKQWFHTGSSTSPDCGSVSGLNLPERTLAGQSCSCTQLRRVSCPCVTYCTHKPTRYVLYTQAHMLRTVHTCPHVTYCTHIPTCYVLYTQAHMLRTVHTSPHVTYCTHIPTCYVLYTQAHMLRSGRKKGSRVNLKGGS